MHKVHRLAKRDPKRDVRKRPHKLAMAHTMKALSFHTILGNGERKYNGYRVGNGYTYLYHTFCCNKLNVEHRSWTTL